MLGLHLNVDLERALGPYALDATAPASASAMNTTERRVTSQSAC